MLLDSELPLCVGDRPRRLVVGLDDVVHIDMAPADRGLIRDLDDGGRAGEPAHVPPLQRGRLGAAWPVVCRKFRLG